MAATVAIVDRLGRTGNQEHTNRVTITMDSSYPTGGEAITAADCGLSSITGVTFEGAKGGAVPDWDQANLKVLVYWVDTTVDGALMAEVTATTDLSSIVFRARVSGRP